MQSTAQNASGSGSKPLPLQKFIIYYYSENFIVD